MTKLWISPFLLVIVISCGQPMSVTAQEAPQGVAQPTEEQKQKEKAEREKNAFTLLDQIVDDAQLLKLPENRISVQINSADILWDRNQARARSLFAGAGDGIAELMRNLDQREQRRGANQSRMATQLRQQLVLTAARHDAPLAYQLLATTRPATPPAADSRNPRPTSEENLEQVLLARIAALDPKMALQNAEQMLDKGQFPRTLGSVLAQLQRKDKEAAAKLEEKILKRLQSVNMLSSVDAGGLALSLLRPGPRTADNPTTETIDPLTDTQPQLLAQAGYVDLMGTVIDAALKSIPQAGTNNQRGPNGGRGRGGLGSRGGQNNVPSAPTDAQVEQSNARGLINGLQSMLAQIDQYLPTRASAVRQKLTELGAVDNQRTTMAQLFNLIRQGSADSLMSAAPTAPPQMQSRIYQQAALKALDEGNVDRARQIATDHLDATARDRVLQQVEFRQISEKSAATRLDELRQTLANLRTDEERVDLLVQLSFAARQNNPKLAIQLLEQAKQLTSRRAVNYQQFEQQLKVAEAFRELEPTRSFEVLEPGIVQLNELLSAAATLSGFEVNVFRDGELPLEARNNLSSMVSRYGQTLGVLAQSDFDRAQMLANRFQLTEPRILARISIVQALLGTQPVRSPGMDFSFRGGIGTGAFVRPPE